MFPEWHTLIPVHLEFNSATRNLIVHQSWRWRRNKTLMCVENACQPGTHFMLEFIIQSTLHLYRDILQRGHYTPVQWWLSVWIHFKVDPIPGPDGGYVHSSVSNKMTPWGLMGDFFWAVLVSAPQQCRYSVDRRGKDGSDGVHGRAARSQNKLC